ncbi:UDP-N-acetylmuramate--L-alanine ligase [Lachnospiraceae bacterium OttesenSCG-928-D06]|nr:UDP-N-acetylmuramate--L-alanine ligase [Lachnospiraceae bacterium OttesenSCG-928-D06]
MYQIDFNHPNSIYFVGIGGISMSGLAEILLNAGFQVSGSDSKSSTLTEELMQKGVSIHYPQQKENITDSIDCAVLTSAIKKDNPEYLALLSMGIPCLTRAQLLGQIMKNYSTPIAVSGTHGKTTTTSMISDILLHANLDPTLSIGGILKSIGGNIRIGQSGLFVTEACEYTNSFLSFHPKISIVLNIEEDHMDFFKDLAHIRSSFYDFIHLLKEDSCLIINTEINDWQSLCESLPCKVITYGQEESCDYCISHISYDHTGHSSFTLTGPDKLPMHFTMQVPGAHNISNAAAAIALANYLHIDTSVIQDALASFTGTDRRFEYKGQIGGITIIDDYAHHPTEITATLQAAENYPHKTTWCVFQPHTYTRTKAFLSDFAKSLSGADQIILTDIFPARETDTLGIHSTDLVNAIKELGKECYYFPSFDETENFLLENCTKGDLLITMGAGDVHKIGENILGI